MSTIPPRDLSGPPTPSCPFLKLMSILRRLATNTCRLAAAGGLN